MARYTFPDARVIATFQPSSDPSQEDDNINLTRASDGAEIGYMQRTLGRRTTYSAGHFDEAAGVFYHKPYRATFAEACTDFLALVEEHRIPLA